MAIRAGLIKVCARGRREYDGLRSDHMIDGVGPRITPSLEETLDMTQEFFQKVRKEHYRRRNNNSSSYATQDYQNR